MNKKNKNELIYKLKIELNYVAESMTGGRFIYEFIKKRCIKFIDFSIVCYSNNSKN